MSKPAPRKETRPTVADDGPLAQESADHRTSAHVGDRSQSAKVPMLLDIFGADTVFLEVRSKEKRPFRKKWQQTSLETMRDPVYLNRLEESGNLAVLLGPASSGLCSIDVDSDDEFHQFLDLNPKLFDTLRTRGARGGNVWVRMLGTYPALSKITTRDGSDWGEWRSEGGCTVVHGIHPKGVPYQIIINRGIVRLPFEEIVWPSGTRLPWQAPEAPKTKVTSSSSHERLVTEFGEPVFFNSRQEVTSLNEGFWAALYAEENIIVYDRHEGGFWKYDASGLYVPTVAAQIKVEISRRILDYSRKSIELKGAEKLRTDRNLTSIVCQLSGIVAKDRPFEGAPPAIHLENGMLEIEGSKAVKKSFSPHYFSRSRIPIKFDPSAQCRRFLEEFLGPAVHGDDAVLLQKLVGQALLGENLVQRLVVIPGSANRGKSQLVELLQILIGRSNCTQLRTAFLAERFELFRYRHKKLLIGVDVDADFLSSKGASVIKGLVGGDTFDAEQKGGTASHPIQGKFNIFITTNCQLSVKLQGDAEAWKRRLVVIPFEGAPPPRRIPKFAEKLFEEEGGGILNWVLRGLALLTEDIEEHGDVKLTPRQLASVGRILGESLNISTFLEANVIVDPRSNLTVTEIEDRYRSFCAATGSLTLCTREIQMQLPEHMHRLFGAKRSNSCRRGSKALRGFRGVGFNPNLFG